MPRLRTRLLKKITSPHQLRSCSGKRRFTKLIEAERILGRMAEQGSIVNLSIYRCQFGKHYHIGHRVILPESLDE